MNYVKLHVDALFAYKRLSDTEFGRGIRCVLQYLADGTEPNLNGKESIMYDVLREQVERDRKAYDKRIAAQTENGKKGGRPRKNAAQVQNPMKPNETQQNPWVFKKTNETQKTQEKEKEKELSSVGFFDDDDDAYALVADHARVLDEAQRAGFPENQATFDLLTALTAQYGADEMVKAIDACVKYGKNIPAYLEVVLENASKPKPADDTPGDWMEDLRRRGIGG